MTALGRRASILIVAVFVTVGLFAWHRPTPKTSSSILQHDLGTLGRTRGFDGQWNYARDADNLLLDSQQCDQAFPGLFEEAERPVNERLHKPITVAELDSMPQQNGYVRAMIYDQQVRTSTLRTESWRQLD